HWSLATAYATADGPGRAAIGAVFAGLNSYLGNYVGELLGELGMSLFFLLSALAMLDAGPRLPKWVGYLGLVTAAAGLLGMFRNATTLLAPVAQVNNYLLPFWMIVFGWALLRLAAEPAPRLR
ncbi:MAG TPA: hypothetical protein VEB59_12590, partial [Gemmatimonadales bacterium]|nr:hypothetical protein [Gemmatimonadales bacterium]